ICSKRAGGYFEAVVQLRTRALEGMLKEAYTILNTLYKKDKKAFIAGVSHVKGGVDIKLGSTKAAKALAAHFKTHHKAEIKESATLVGRKEGKDVYRTTILIRV
ncbi:MAG: NMD3-related protein, partial [Candidatus Hydrothermarchaeales archaeon]